MTTRLQPPPDTNGRAALLWRALELTAGPALLVDEELRIVGTTPAASRLLGAPVKDGAHAVRVLGGGGDPTLAEAFSPDRSATTTVRAGPVDRESDVRVRTTPLRIGGAFSGWLVRLTEERATVGAARGLESLSTRDTATARIFEIAALLAECDASVLVTGEMGVGKTTLATAIHAQSPRRAQPLRILTSAAMTPALLEQQLLGRTRSESAGTVLLEDVTELPHDTQGWLLRVLEAEQIAPSDGGPPRPYDLRTFATTHVSLEREVEAGRFRADLSVRLRTVALELPPLRARRGDVALLTERFVAALSQKSKRQVKTVAPEALARLEAHDWPGNVRELEVALEAAFAVGRGATLSLADVERSLPPLPGAPREVVLTPTPPPPDAGDEANRIRRALERAGGDRTRAAAMLGMSRTTLWRRMRAHGLDR